MMYGVYPTLERWMDEHNYEPERVALALYITTDKLRHRLKGTTPFNRLEQEKLEQISGIPRKMLFRREGE